MKNLSLAILTLFLATHVSAQNKDLAKVIEIPEGKGYYYETIMKDISRVSDSIEKKELDIRIDMDQSAYQLPNKVNLYKKVWANSSLSQGNSGSCWDFSTLSFYESEIYRQFGKQIKLSEMYIVYCEYIEKARRFVIERGNSLFDEGSEGNALARLSPVYGLMPATAYTGLINGYQFIDHSKMVKEMKTYLESIEKSNAWNEEQVLATIKDILNHYMGIPPSIFVVDGKEYSPQLYLKDYLKLNTRDFVEILSYKQKPYWEKVEYTVPDNWWHSEDYYNVPLDDFITIIKNAIREGYSMSIGGDVSEAGFSRDTQCALVPDFDIPSAYINDDARAFRFDNETTTDDHGMHLIGYIENYNKEGKDWFLIKDSSSGSRNNDIKAPEFGYYFFSEDYIKLKMMGFTIHKDAVKYILEKFE